MTNQVIDATFAPSDVKAVESKSIWSSVWGLTKNLSSTTYEYVGKMSKEVIAPAVSKATVVTINSIDKGCVAVVDTGMQVLNTHDGIAMVLSPSTILRMAAIKAYERKYGGKTSDAVNAAAGVQQ